MTRKKKTTAAPHQWRMVLRRLPRPVNPMLGWVVEVYRPGQVVRNFAHIAGSRETAESIGDAWMMSREDGPGDTAQVLREVA